MRLHSRLARIEARMAPADPVVIEFIIGSDAPLEPGSILIGGSPEQQAEQEALNVAYWRGHPDLCPPSRRRELGL